MAEQLVTIDMSELAVRLVEIFTEQPRPNGAQPKRLLAGMGVDGVKFYMMAKTACDYFFQQQADQLPPGFIRRTDDKGDTEH